MNFDKVLSNLAGSGVLGGLAGGAVSGALMNSKKARKTAGTALKVGGLAALGGMAWKAYQSYQGQQSSQKLQAAGAGATAPTDQVWGDLNSEGFAIDTADTGSHSRGLLLIQAMIAAAFADGHVDDGERERIMQSVQSADLSGEEKALVFDAMHKPPNQLQLCQGVDCPELAAEVYLASALAVDESRIEAGLYLDALAYRLGIPESLVQQIHNELPAPSKAVA